MILLLPKKIIFVLGLFLILGFFIYGYFTTIPPKSATKGRPDRFPLTVVDSYQRAVTLDREPLRVVSVAPNITEIIYALGKGASLVGRTEYCDYPVAALQVNSIGRMMDPNIEKIVQLKPDLVIASTHFQKEVLEKLDGLGIKVVVFYGAESFNGIYTTIRQVGKTLNARWKAETLISDMQKKVNRVTELVKASRRPQVYYVVSFGKAGDFTTGKDTFIGNMIEMAGGDNIANDTKGWQYSLEKLVTKNPDLVICSRYYNAKNGIQKAIGYRDLPAIKAGKIYEIDNNLLDRQGPRAADGLVSLAKLLQPELFSRHNEELE